MRDSAHLVDMLIERGIERAWAQRTTDAPDRTESHQDGTRHYLKRIPEFGNRWLRVVVSVDVSGETRVTAFFDRRLRHLT